MQLFSEMALAVFAQFEHCALSRAVMCGFGQELYCALSTYPRAFQGECYISKNYANSCRLFFSETVKDVVSESR